MASTLNTTKLPSKKKVLTLFFLYKEAKRKAVHDASHCATEVVTKVWAKTSIPTCPKKHVVMKLEEMFKEWAKLKGNKHSEELQLKEKKWKDGLVDLFDFAHANALGMTTIQEDKKFLPF